tara:strand:+ start:659 stop:1030 length:372 start_codon:yes stop_codon:yes gene_type:complete
LKKIDYKFSEDKSIELLKNHIDKTYSSHYSKNKFQSTEFITDSGHGTGFCIGNIMKYAQRYGKKGTPEDHQKDLLKILHYAIIQLHIHQKDNESADERQLVLGELASNLPKDLLDVGEYGEGC